VDLYNTLAPCALGKYYCPDNADEMDVSWAIMLNENITSIADKWDFKGEFNADNLDQTNLFAAYMKELDLWKHYVDFGLDKKFSIDNPVSKFSRAVLFWGSPLNFTGNKLASEISEEEEEMDEKYENYLKSYVIDTFLEKMNNFTESSYSNELNSYYFMGILIFEVILEIVTRDAMLTIISIVFVFFYIRLQVRSWFLALIEFFSSLTHCAYFW